MESKTGNGESFLDIIELIKELSRAEIKYIICGGVACVLQGVERATYDLDITVSFDENNLRKVIEVIKRSGLFPRIPEPIDNLLDEKKRKEWLREKGALVYTVVSGNTPLQLDIFLSYPKSYEELFESADEIEIDGLRFKISSIEDLLFVKRLIDPIRDKDLTDIKELEKIYEQKNKSGKRS